MFPNIASLPTSYFPVLWTLRLRSFPLFAQEKLLGLEMARSIIPGHVCARGCNQRAESRTVCVYAFLPTCPTGRLQKKQAVGSERAGDVLRVHLASLLRGSGTGQLPKPAGRSSRVRQRTLSKGEGAKPPDVSSVTGVSCLTLPVPGSPRLKTACGDAHLGRWSVRGVCGVGGGSSRQGGEDEDWEHSGTPEHGPSIQEMVPVITRDVESRCGRGRTRLGISRSCGFPGCYLMEKPGSECCALSLSAT